MKNFINKSSRLNIVRLKHIVASSKIEKDSSFDRLVGGFSQSISIGGDDTISDGQTNNCNGTNCHKRCGQYPPDTPVGPNTVCLF